jgi:hypothetical protein
LRKSGRFLSRKHKVVPFGKFHPKCRSFMLTTPDSSAAVQSVCGYTIPS